MEEPKVLEIKLTLEDFEKFVESDRKQLSVFVKNVDEVAEIIFEAYLNLDPVELKDALTSNLAAQYLAALLASNEGEEK